MGSTLFTKQDLPLWMQMQQDAPAQAKEQYKEDYFQRQKDLSAGLESPDIFSDITELLTPTNKLVALTMGLSAIPLALTKKGWEKGVKSVIEAMGDKVSPDVSKEIFKAAVRVPRKIRQSVDKLEPLTPESSKFWRNFFETHPNTRAAIISKKGFLDDSPLRNTFPPIRDTWKEGTTEIIVHPKRALKAKEEAIEFIPHEFWHDIIYSMPNSDIKVLYDTYSKMTARELRYLMDITGTKLYTPHELMSEAGACYTTGNSIFTQFPEAIAKLVKKYAKLNR